MNFPESWRSLDVTLCHDWLTGMRGGERVLEILCEGFPSAPIHTLICKPSAVSDTIRRHRIVTSWLRMIPGIHQHYRAFLPFFPAAVASLPRAGGDLLISTSHCAAKGAPLRPGTRHLCYCFTPMRYAWLFRDAYFAGRSVQSILAAPLLAWLRHWDRAASARVDHFVAISNAVQDRIRRFYGRESDVVYPPVNTDAFTPGGARRADFDLIVSALVPYKRIDLAVRASRDSGVPLKIVGVGTELERLRGLSGPGVEFLGWRSDDEIRELYRQCRFLLFPGEEDFGIVPLEAQACGTPVIAFARGGALETVVPGVSGVFFAEQTPESMRKAMDDAAAIRWTPAAIRANAERFGIQHFIDGLARSIETCRAQDAKRER